MKSVWWARKPVSAARPCWTPLRVGTQARPISTVSCIQTSDSVPSSNSRGRSRAPACATIPSKIATTPAVRAFWTTSTSSTGSIEDANRNFAVTKRARSLAISAPSSATTAAVRANSPLHASLHCAKKWAASPSRTSSSPSFSHPSRQTPSEPRDSHRAPHRRKRCTLPRAASSTQSESPRSGERSPFSRTITSPASPTWTSVPFPSFDQQVGSGKTMANRSIEFADDPGASITPSWSKSARISTVKDRSPFKMISDFGFGISDLKSVPSVA